ncbi:MAG TPA: hypothetical protein VG389_09315, partial [Myxococcota bacterium]|nr:hypothetical protein [Myxococcota bacterium]
MTKTHAPLTFFEPKLMRIPSPQIRTLEAALEMLIDHPTRRWDVWLTSAPRTSDIIGMRERLDEEKMGRAIALIALADDFDAIRAAEAMAAGVKALFPTTIPPHNLERIVGTVLDRQRELAAYAAVKKQQAALAVQEAKIRATEQSMSRKLYGALTPLTGEVAPNHSLQQAMEEFERLYISRVLAECKGDALQARKTLKVSRSSFYRYLAAHKLQHLVRH